MKLQGMSRKSSHLTKPTPKFIGKGRIHLAEANWRNHGDSMKQKPIPPKTKKIECSDDGSSYSFKAGDLFYFEFHRHESVGKEVEFEIGDDRVISQVDTYEKYVHPENMKPGWTGGDLQKCQWLFRAEKSGTTSMLIRYVFRGHLESECRIDITVS